MSLTMTTDSKTLSEEMRLARQAAQEAEAFAELYRRHVTRVYRYHLAHSGNVKDAEDLTSQTFLAALEGIRSFRGDGSFAAWIMGIAVRRRALFFRRRRPEVPLEAASLFPDPRPDPAQAAFSRLEAESLSRLIQQISPDRREALILRFFSGLTFAEAARVLHKSEAAVKMLVARGLDDLRQRISPVLEVEK